jgi:hypothetical protein
MNPMMLPLSGRATVSGFTLHQIVQAGMKYGNGEPTVLEKTFGLLGMADGFVRNPQMPVCCIT